MKAKYVCFGGYVCPIYLFTYLLTSTFVKFQVVSQRAICNVDYLLNEKRKYGFNLLSSLSLKTFGLIHFQFIE